jgi:glycine/D-amino acid oxidase-like deaminating enzyme
VAERFDVAIIGGGIIGTCAAAYLADAGVSVALYERDGIAAAASGRNLGAIQHPFDAAFAALYHASLPLYRELDDPDFTLAGEPAGLLLLSFDPAEVKAAGDAIAAQSPDLTPTLLDSATVHEMEPALAPELYACRVATGYPVAPAAATNAFANRARRAGATIEVGDAAAVVVERDAAVGVRLENGRVIAADKVLVAAGPWTSDVVPGWAERRPIRPLWGVIASVEMEVGPRAVLEELGIDRPGPQPDQLFSSVTAGGSTGIGSAFLEQQPDPAHRARRLVEDAARFMPALAGVQPVRVRMCARPLAFDRRPLIGAVPGIESLFVCSGHGPWGISTGPASARVVVDEMLGRGEVPLPLRANRVGQAVGASWPTK